MSELIFYAHSSPIKDHGPPKGWQLLRDHLRQVAHLAKRLAVASGVPDLPAAAEAAGWLHDLGKYRESFVRYICYGLQIGPKGHKQAGAVWADDANNLPLASAILGHHGGMPDAGPNGGEIPQEVECEDNGRPVFEEVWDTAVGECPELATLPAQDRSDESAETDLFTRLLFACLVDADWTDTSEHERHVMKWDEFPKPPPLQPAERLTRLLGYIGRRASCNRDKNPELADIRRNILEACLTAAEQEKGLFALTVPTGGGKTLSGLAFALKHAARHGLRRVIYVAPYISILEQNADVIRAALGVTERDLDVFEHQSLAEPQGSQFADEMQASAAARRAENWDAPVVITTNVQFFESLFSNKPGRCRKLHNIAGSVIILDECQTLPPDLVKPTCQMLKQLTATLGCTVVLCTATQPAFDHPTLGEHQLEASEIIPKQCDLFAALKRVQLVWPANRDERLSWPEVAARMTANPSALCVVNTKKAALDLFEELKKLSQNVFHLSTSMCPAHRVVVLDAVKKRLETRQEVYFCSTQLIEAGVDVDFYPQKAGVPTVFREMAPLEAILQAAGRCNREGRIPNAGGRVVVFRSEEGKLPLDRWYIAGVREVEARLQDDANKGKEHPQVHNPDDVRDYFQRLYYGGNLDKHEIVAKRAGLLFDSTAKVYRLIDDDTVPVVVAWKDGVETEEWFSAWQEIQLRKDPHADVRSVQQRLDALTAQANRANFRALAPFQVNVFISALLRLPDGIVVPISKDIDLLRWHGVYDQTIGIKPEIPLDVLIG